MIKAGQHQRRGRLKKTLRCAMIILMAWILLLPVNLPSAYGEPTIAEVQAQADEASAKLAVMEAETETIRSNYWMAVEEHETALAAMGEAQGRIDAAEAVISDTQRKLGNRANQMYRDGIYSFLEVIFGASSFEAFTNSWDLLNMINLENAKLIQANKDARNVAQTAHEEYSAQEQVANARMLEIRAIKIRAEELVAEQQALLNGLNAEVSALVEKEQEARRAAQEAENRARNVNGYIPPDIPGGGYGSVVAAAASRIGCAYVLGGSGPNVFDCSGLTSWSYLQSVGIWIGRNSESQLANASARWSYASGGAAVGDVLYWPGHVAVYAGGGSYIHAPFPGASVCYSSWDLSSAIVLRF